MPEFGRLCQKYVFLGDIWYLWDYRVRRNSNTGTIKKTAYKCRYWWEMYNNNNGRRSFKYRSDLRNGWLLSNSELIAVALGR